MAEINCVPPPPGFKPSTNASTPGLAVAAIALIPKSLVVAIVPCLRKPMPVAPLLPFLGTMETGPPLLHIKEPQPTVAMYLTFIKRVAPLLW